MIVRSLRKASMEFSEHAQGPVSWKASQTWVFTWCQAAGGKVFRELYQFTGQPLMALLLEQRKFLVSISDHWICPGPGEIPDGEPWQPDFLAVGIFHPLELLQPCSALILGDTGDTLGAHPSQSIQLSSHIFAVMKCCTEKDWHMKLNGPNVLPKTCQSSLKPWVMAPRHCSSLSSNKQPALVSGQGGNCEGNRTSSLPVLLYCPWNTKLGHKRLAKPGRATFKCQQKQGLSRAQPSWESAARSLGHTHKGKEQHTRSNTDHRLTAFPSLAPPQMAEDRWQAAGLGLQVLQQLRMSP